jgi:hypothetical protein
VEVEDDDKSVPKFLQESFLGERRVKPIIRAIKDVTSRLPLSDTDEERLKEKKSDGSAKGKEARAGQKSEEACNKGKSHPHSFPSVIHHQNAIWHSKGRPQPCQKH